MSAKQTLVSGIRASGTPHLGNYLGALKQFISLQDEYRCFFFIADLHSLTTPFDPKQQRLNSIAVAADYLALGLDPNKSTIFLQSQVAEHAELAWIFNCLTPLGELQRMTQFKDKSSSTAKDNINAGLLNYPILMAADILLYKPSVVPVGEDQSQHVELARTIARKFNNRFGKTFVEPKDLLNKSTMRIKSFKNPEKKMSKSNDEPLYISDSPETIKNKFKKAVTATDAKGKSAGVNNLLLLLREFGNKDQIKYFENSYADNTIRFSELKETLAEQVSGFFAEFRDRRNQLIAKPGQIAMVLGQGAAEAKTVARETMLEVKEKLGLL